MPSKFNVRYNKTKRRDSEGGWTFDFYNRHDVVKDYHIVYDKQYELIMAILTDANASKALLNIKNENDVIRHISILRVWNGNPVTKIGFVHRYFEKH